MTDAFEADSFGALYGVDKPSVLSESVGVSHNPLYFVDKNRKKNGSVSCFETVMLYFWREQSKKEMSIEEIWQKRRGKRIIK